MDMRNNNSGLGKKGDYWYIDRKGRGVRTLLVAVAGSLALLSSACSSNTSMMLEDASATRGTSSLLGDTTSLLTSTTTTVLDTTTSLLSTKWYIDCGVISPTICPLTTAFDGTTLVVKSTKSLDKFEAYFTDRSKLNASLNTQSYSFRVPKGKTLEGFMVRLKADGSKWFFDNGKWFVDVDSSRWYGDVD